LFEQHTVSIIDTDVIAHELVQVNSPTLTDIVNHFGNVIIDQQGHLNRRLLRDIITTNGSEREWLNELMHPRIFNAVVNQLERLSHESHLYLVVVIPLLHANSPYLPLLDEVWVVDCDESLQKQRLKVRDRMNEESAQQLIKTQPSRKERLDLATTVIVNSGDISSLIEQTEQQHLRLLTSSLIKKH
jgi:dephospho-CoA kinase